MKRLLIVFVPVLAWSADLTTGFMTMDSQRGDKLFETQGCVQCHTLKGKGGNSAPDLGRVLDRAYTPSELASAMWNHAPTMWAAIKDQSLKVGTLDRQAAADLFASFYSARYFEMPGDAGRGRKLFASKSCTACHGLESPVNPQAKPVSQWQSVSDPVALVADMWNHSPAMRAELAKRKLRWPELTAQDVSDLLNYLRNSSPAMRNAAPSFNVSVAGDGAKLFASKGCTACHKSVESLGPAQTLTAVSAAMWNHASYLGAAHTEPPRLDPAEIRELVGYFWAKPFFENTGDAAKGRRQFAARHCADCHSGAGPGPKLSDRAGEWNGITMVSALWRHGPSMLEEFNKRKIPWPVFHSGDMPDLIAFLNQKSAAGAKPGDANK